MRVRAARALRRGSCVPRQASRAVHRASCDRRPATGDRRPATGDRRHMMREGDARRTPPTPRTKRDTTRTPYNHNEER
ncbi:serine/threonine protein phosphatase [Burkholderia pseudomallei]|nr:serine/threonine protein phosphatase [Burkholderia pseudomallei]NRD87654.1 serine/threonine protein phosphatase [Burkholderia pseudomallei]